MDQPILPLCSNSKTNSIRGFTLIEVIVVIAIIGIMSAIAIPAINSWLPNYRLKSEARLVYSHLQRAKSEAVKRNAEVTMIFNSGTGAPCQGGDYTFTDSNGDVVLVYTVEEGICLETSSEFPDGFRASGLRSSPAADGEKNVVLSHIRAGRDYTITQSIAGGLRLE